MSHRAATPSITLSEQSWTVQLWPIAMFQDISVRFISSEQELPLAAPLHEVPPTAWVLL